MTKFNKNEKLDFDKLTMAEFIELVTQNEELTKNMKRRLDLWNIDKELM